MSHRDELAGHLSGCCLSGCCCCLGGSALLSGRASCEHSWAALWIGFERVAAPRHPYARNFREAMISKTPSSTGATTSGPQVYWTIPSLNETPTTSPRPMTIAPVPESDEEMEPTSAQIAPVFIIPRPFQDRKIPSAKTSQPKKLAPKGTTPPSGDDIIPTDTNRVAGPHKTMPSKNIPRPNKYFFTTSLPLSSASLRLPPSTNTPPTGLLFHRCYPGITTSAPSHKKQVVRSLQTFMRACSAVHMLRGSSPLSHPHRGVAAKPCTSILFFIRIQGGGADGGRASRMQDSARVRDSQQRAT